MFCRETGHGLLLDQNKVGGGERNYIAHITGLDNSMDGVPLTIMGLTGRGEKEMTMR